MSALRRRDRLRGSTPRSARARRPGRGSPWSSRCWCSPSSSRSCQQSQIKVSQEEALATAEAAGRLRARAIRRSACCARGFDRSRSGSSRSRSRDPRTGDLFDELAVVRIDAKTGEVVEVDGGQEHRKDATGRPDAPTDGSPDREPMRLLVLQHIACEHPGVFSEVIARAGRGGGRGRARRGRGAARLARVRRGAGDGRADGRRRRRRASLARAREAPGARRGRGRARPSSASASACSCWPPRSGRRSTPLERAEVGLLPVELTAEGSADPLFAGHRGAAGHPAVARRHLRPARRRRPAGALADGAQPGVPLGRARLRGPVPPRGHRRDGAASGPRCPPTGARSPTPSARRGRRLPRRDRAPRRPSFTRPPAACSPTGSTSPRAARLRRREPFVPFCPVACI